MGLAFDLAHHLAQQTYLGRVASVSASGHFRKLGLVTESSGLPSILLQKFFWGGERKFLEPLIRFTRGDVRDHIVSSKIDHGPP